MKTANTTPRSFEDWESKRLEALVAIDEQIRRDRIAPTYEEIAAAVEVGYQTARTLVNSLCAHGYIRRKVGCVRAIAITTIGRTKLAALKKVAA